MLFFFKIIFQITKEKKKYFTIVYITEHSKFLKNKIIHAIQILNQIWKHRFSRIFDSILKYTKLIN